MPNGSQSWLLILDQTGPITEPKSREELVTSSSENRRGPLVRSRRSTPPGTKPSDCNLLFAAVGQNPAGNLPENWH